MIAKEALPRSAALNEWLHQGSFGLNGMHQVVARPLMEQLTQRDDPQFLMLSLPAQVRRRDFVEHRQTIPTQAGKFFGQGEGRLGCIRLGALAIGIKGGKILTGQNYSI